MSYQTAVGGWHDFYILAGTASATLVGLLFVGLSLHLRIVVASSEVRSLARMTLTNFGRSSLRGPVHGDTRGSVGSRFAAQRWAVKRKRTEAIRRTARDDERNDLDALAALLSGAGFIAAEEEADELLACAAGDVKLLDSLVGRRLTGEPLAWIIGSVSFCGLEIRVDPGVYVPRWQSEPLARRAVKRLPAAGVAIDLCTGAGAIAKTLTAHRPRARVVASDIDERAVACAAANGVEVYRGDLFAPLPRTLEGHVDVVVGVVPYVPTPALPRLQRDTFAFESPLSYDGGRDGTQILRRVLTDSPRFLRRGGALLLELGGQQADALAGDLERLGYVDATVLVDQDGDVRGIETTLGAAVRAIQRAGVRP